MDRIDNLGVNVDIEEVRDCEREWEICSGGYECASSHRRAILFLLEKLTFQQLLKSMQDAYDVFPAMEQDTKERLEERFECFFNICMEKIKTGLGIQHPFYYHPEI